MAKYKRNEGSIYRNKLTVFYQRKYHALFKNLFKIEGLEKDTAGYIMTKLLFTGTLSGWRIGNFDWIGEIGFSPYTLVNYDMYGNPLKVRLLSERQSPLVNINKTYHNHKDISIIRLDFVPAHIINDLIEKIVDVDMTIRTNVKLHKMPFLTRGLDSKQLKAIEDLLDDELIVNSHQLVESVATGTPYVIDKLYRYKSELEHELYTMLGVDNIKFDKGAQLSLDEVNANNEEVNQFKTIIKDKLETWFNEINDLFDVNIIVKEKEVEQPAYQGGDDVEGVPFNKGGEPDEE